jgi:site-specific DNA-methyltransferase (adenine-specific)
MTTLYNDDCLQVMGAIPDKSVDMVLCDPPYGITACKWDVVIPFEPLWEQYKRIIKDRGAIVLFGSQPFTSFIVSSNYPMFKYEWIWDKKKPAGFQLAKVRPMIKHENILVFCKGSPMYYPIRTPRDRIKKNSFQSKSESSPLAKHDGIERVYTDFLPKSIIEISNANQRNRLHPTQKPVALLEYLIKTYTLERETVLDNCMGSGSTGVACINTNRNFIGIEKDDKYFEIAKKRIEDQSNNCFNLTDAG